MSRTATVSLVSILASLSIARVALAQAPAETTPPGGESPPPSAMPPPSAAAPPPAASAEPSTEVPAATVSDDGAPTRPADLSYGVAARLRWVSIPAWMLGLFTRENVPLSSWGTGLELFRRKGNFDLVASFSYINLSPPDGNWLGKDPLLHPAGVDTDLVQFRGLALYGLDVSILWHNFFNDWFGMHVGAGIGVGIVGGKILRTSNFGCTEQNKGDLSQCHPMNVPCSTTSCSEQALNALPPRMDSPTTPSRFTEPSVPPVLPIVNLLVGFSFRLPQVRGWEAKLQGGFHNTFFLGGGVGYTF
jgi:hypothetical protein